MKEGIRMLKPSKYFAPYQCVIKADGICPIAYPARINQTFMFYLYNMMTREEIFDIQAIQANL